jgi:hypothetical protein
MSNKEERITDLLSNFEDKYHNILLALDDLHKGTFNEEDSTGLAALCLITQNTLLAELAAADLAARALKKDVEFAKANAYYDLKEQKVDGKKPAEAALAQLVLRDSEVVRLTNEQNTAERDYKNLSNVFSLLKEAHLTFRSIKKGNFV